jgi:hypothetical protein
MQSGLICTGDKLINLLMVYRFFIIYEIQNTSRDPHLALAGERQGFPGLSRRGGTEGGGFSPLNRYSEYWLSNFIKMSLKVSSLAFEKQRKTAKKQLQNSLHYSCFKITIENYTSHAS